ncbi:MAG: diaminopimelate epimerase [Gammaproteobacteria bacterium]|nr:diaminopimelate epimerase [Gammaproteobacteria bacterium]
MSVRFTKMHSLGNDFMVIDGVTQSLSLDKKTIQHWADRHTGIGFDQCLLIEKSHQPDIDFLFRIFNADGNEVAQCGNGARCMARFAHHYGLTKKLKFTVATQTTCMTLILQEDHAASVVFAPPIFSAPLIPVTLPELQGCYTVMIEETEVKLHAVNMGNPHAVMLVDDLTQMDVAGLGKAISEHPGFPLQTNVEFMTLTSPQRIDLRVYERGCGETQACGSGAVAAAVIAMTFYQMPSKLVVGLPGGELIVAWLDRTQGVSLTGPVALVYEGVVL